MDIEGDSVKQEEAPKPPSTVLPEVELFVQLLVTIFLIDKKQYDLVSCGTVVHLFLKAASCATTLVERLHSFNRITLNPLSAKIYFYYSYSHELINKLEDIRGYGFD